MMRPYPTLPEFRQKALNDAIKAARLYRAYPRDTKEDAAARRDLRLCIRVNLESWMKLDMVIRENRELPPHVVEARCKVRRMEWFLDSAIGTSNEEFRRYRLDKAKAELAKLEGEG